MTVRGPTSDVGRRTSDGCIAWITGGGTGIGRALAARLLQEGARVIITGRRKDVLEKTAGELRSAQGAGELHAMAGDASDASHVHEVVAQAEKRWGPITLLINNAGTNFTGHVLQIPFEEYVKSFEVNCLSAVRTTQAVLPAMRQANRGAIINISSIYGRWGSSNSAPYSVSKFALAGFTDVLRQGLADTQVHVMGVFPGFIKTDMTMPFVQPGSLKSYLGKTPDQMAKAILSALRRRKAELYYPWYVPWFLRFHRWFPGTSDRMAPRVKR